MSHGILASAESDVVDPDFGEVLAMTLLLRVVLPALELEDDDLLVARVADDLARHLRAGEHGAGRRRIYDCSATCFGWTRIYRTQ